MTAKERIACALDEAGFASSEDGFLDSLKSGMKNLLGGGGDKDGGDNDIAAHDKRHHPQGFNPETDTCSWRDKKIEQGGDPAIYKAPTGQYAKGGNGGAAPKNEGGKTDGKNGTIMLKNGEQLSIVDGVLKVPPSLGNIELKVDAENVHSVASLIEQLELAKSNPEMTEEQKLAYESVMEHLKENFSAEENGTEGNGTEGNADKPETVNVDGEEIPKKVDPKDWAAQNLTETMLDNLMMYDKDGNLVQFETQEEFDAALRDRARELQGAVTEYDATMQRIATALKNIDDMVAAFANEHGVEYERQFEAFTSAVLDAELAFTQSEGIDELDSEQAKDEWKKYKECFEKKEYDKARKHKEKFEEIRDKVLNEQKEKALDEKFRIDENRDIGDGQRVADEILNKPLDIVPDPDSVLESGERISEVMMNDKFAKGLLDAQELIEVHAGPTVAKYVFSVGENHNFSKFGKGNVLSDTNVISAINGALGFNPSDPKNPRNAIVRLEGDKVVVEVPNQERKTVGLANLLQNEEFKRKFEARKAEGKATCPVSISASDGDVVFTWDMDEDPHIAFAGTTGAGKSVAFTSAIRSLMNLYGPDEIGFLLADPKMVEFSDFNGSKHLECPVATDSSEIKSMVKNLQLESAKRKKILAEAHCANIAEYNMKFPDKKMKRLVLGIDELSYLVTELGEDFRDKQLSQLMKECRSQGIHVMWGTQTPSKQVLGADIVNNTGARVGLKCKDGFQSQQILGPGHTEAMDVMKRGDGYFSSESANTCLRMQAPFSPKEEQDRITQVERGESVDIPEGGFGGGASGGGGGGNGSGEPKPEPAPAPAPKKETLAERKERMAKEAEEAKAKAVEAAQKSFADFAALKPEERMAEYDKEMNSEIGRAIAAAQAENGGNPLSRADMAMIAKPIQDKYAMLKQNELAQSGGETTKMTASEMAYQQALSELDANQTLENRRKAVEAEMKVAMEKTTSPTEKYQVEKKYGNVLKQIDADMAEEAQKKQEEEAQKKAAKDKESEKKMPTYNAMIEAYNATKTEEGNTDEANIKYLDALKAHQLAKLDAQNLPPEEDAEQRKAIRAEYDKNSAPYRKNIESKKAEAEKAKADKAKAEEAERVRAEKEKAQKAKEDEKAAKAAEKEKAQKAKAEAEEKTKAEAEKKAKRKNDARAAYEKEPTAANRQSIVEIDAEEAVERAKAKKYKTEAERAEAIRKVQEEEAEKVEVAKTETTAESLKKTLEGMKDLLSKDPKEMSEKERKELKSVRLQFADNEQKRGAFQIERMRREGKHKDGSPYTEKDYKRDMARLTRWSNWAHNTAQENTRFKRMFDPYTFDHALTAKEIMQEAMDEAEYGVVEDAEAWLKDDEPTAKERIEATLNETEG